MPVGIAGGGTLRTRVGWRGSLGSGLRGRRALLWPRGRSRCTHLGVLRGRRLAPGSGLRAPSISTLCWRKTRAPDGIKRSVHVPGRVAQTRHIGIPGTCLGSSQRPRLTGQRGPSQALALLPGDLRAPGKAVFPEEFCFLASSSFTFFVSWDLAEAVDYPVGLWRLRLWTLLLHPFLSGLSGS